MRLFGGCSLTPRCHFALSLARKGRSVFCRGAPIAVSPVTVLRMGRSRRVCLQDQAISQQDGGVGSGTHRKQTGGGALINDQVKRSF
jgi:hypothetical protein